MAAVLLGCNRTDNQLPAGPSEPSPGPSAAGQADSATGPFAAGKKVFAAQGCAKCHSVGGAGSPGGPPTAGGPFGPGGKKGFRGPDLAHVGKDSAHTIEWLQAHIRNAKSHKPDSRMPAFEGKINESDLRALAEYLGS